MKVPFEEDDLSLVRNYPLDGRDSEVRVSQFARSHQPGDGIRGWPDRLQRLLAGDDLRAVVAAILSALRAVRAIICGLGAHVVKAGLSPGAIDLKHCGGVSALATNGAGTIHDFEVALSGATSEIVDRSLGPGTLGMATQTGEDLNAAISDGVARRMGTGQAVGAYVQVRRRPFAAHSVFATASAFGIPITVHVALGTDIIHTHPSVSGVAPGEGSLRDFRYCASSVAQLESGASLNSGSAVILPEVNLKAVALACDAGPALEGLTTVNLDFLRHGRPQANVVTRPTAGVGRGYALTGHHEILIPLFAAAVVEGLDG